MFDTIVRNGQTIMHFISDLKACYDRKLLNVGYMVQKAARVQRDFSKIIHNILPRMEY